MKKILHIVATPRGNDSRTLKVSATFLEAIKGKYPSCGVDELNLYSESLPPLSVNIISGKYVLLSGKGLSDDLKEHWRGIEECIRRFLSADAYLISCPMWNFSVPYALKQYIDIILQPGYLFSYSEKGPEGLVKNRKMAVITSRGGDYGPGSPFKQYDFQEPYLRAVFGFIGISDMVFINAQPMDAMGPEVQSSELRKAQALARSAAASF